MGDSIQGLSKEQIEEVIQIFNPCMDDYLYIFDLKRDYYRAGKKKFHNLHYRWLDKNGLAVWINCRGQVLDDDDGNPRYLIGCINETGKKQRADNISGLLGESGLASYLTPYGNKIPSGFLMRIGIDDFSAINGDFGMTYGDYILKNVADCIHECLTENQQLFRIVADEFMIVDINGAVTDDAIAIYKSIKRKISAFIDSEKYKSVFTISAGILDTSRINGNYNDYLKLTEFALKQAKADGKNNFYIFNQDDYSEFLRKRRITMELHHAVDNNFEGFEAYYQPIVDSNTYCLLGAEALMRFSIPASDGSGYERISPAEFIPLLEETGLIIPAGRWMLNEAVSMCSEMQKSIPGFRINVNISYIQVIKSSVLKDILAIREKYNLAPQCIGIEVTESGYLESNPHFLKLWNGLKSNGIKLILDDFGTGYSNLHCLGDLNPTYIKVDKNFTQKAMKNAYDHELMVKIIEMAHSLGLMICVEGIEKADELEDIRKIHADYIQGYLFGKPYCKAEFYEKFV